MGTILGMNAAETIRKAVADVATLRAQTGDDTGLREAAAAVKGFQAQRFFEAYADILVAGPFAAAAQFFLTELYGDNDYSNRDAQFARIAGALQTMLPKPAVETAVLLAQLHVLTETLDHDMALAWQSLPAGQQQSPSLHYALAWQKVGRESDRRIQLEKVLAMGRDLDRLTRTPGLRLMLKLMRRPAKSAGLSELQRFLESGFDTFADLGRHKGQVENFLALIEQRESALIADLFHKPAAQAANLLDGLRGKLAYWGMHKAKKNAPSFDGAFLALIA